MTEVDRLKADPYAFYARKMLGLTALDPVDADPSAAWRGSAVHAVLEAWMKEDDCDPARLRARAEALLTGQAGASADARALAAAAHRGDRLHRRPGRGQSRRGPAAAGGRSDGARCELAGVTLGGKADRIDRLADGGLAIVDYKTGTPPSGRAVRDGYSLQLGLLGLIADRGGFDGIEGAAACFEYWSLARDRAGALGYVKSPVGGRSGIDAARIHRAWPRATSSAAAAQWLTGDGAVHRQAPPRICALWRI